MSAKPTIVEEVTRFESLIRNELKCQISIARESDNKIIALIDTPLTGYQFRRAGYLLDILQQKIDLGEVDGES